MKMTLKTLLLTGLLAPLAMISAQAAPIVTNGDFSAGKTDWSFTDLNSGGVGHGGFGTYASDAPAFNFVPVNSGGITNFAYLQEAGSITQTISLSANTIYTLTLDVAARAYFAAPLPVVTINDGASNINLYSGATNEGNTNVDLAFSDQNYVANTFTFTTGATVGSGAFIQLANLHVYPTDGDNTADFANVAIVATGSTVPEPSSYALVGFGLLSLFGMLRYRKLA